MQMSPGTVRHLCRPLSTESTNPAEAALLFKPTHTRWAAGWVQLNARAAVKKGCGCNLQLHFARLCRLILACLPPSCDRLGRFGLASSLSSLDRLARSGLACAHHTVYCPGLLRIPILLLPTHRRAERPTGPDRQCPPLSQPGSFCLLHGRVQPTGECRVQMGEWRG